MFYAFFVTLVSLLYIDVPFNLSKNIAIYFSINLSIYECLSDKFKLNSHLKCVAQNTELMSGSKGLSS